MPIELEITKPQMVRAATLKIHCKIGDEFTASVVDDRDEVIFQQEAGYVWALMPGQHYGDYIILDIDLETGMVKNWKAPTAKELREQADAIRDGLA